jgi:hypothetical protein
MAGLLIPSVIPFSMLLSKSILPYQTEFPLRGSGVLRKKKDRGRKRKDDLVDVFPLLAASACPYSP